ncbi:hypothetical protein Dxin01_02800 [Deinococcus xinjiangensis]|uniref:Uncharacterized protein n=1 Tax=Deinococcus xinjiangensis TaxID=457454 RepID=A0ABP9VEA5_9DEIO
MTDFDHNPNSEERQAAAQPPNHAPNNGHAQNDLPADLASGLLDSPIFAPPAKDQNEAGEDQELVDFIPELQPMYSGNSPFLARFLPSSPPTHAGLNTEFCDLHAFLKYLHEQTWHGYLHAALGEQSAYVLLYEGRTVAAAAANATGEQALGELLSLYEQGAILSAHPLSPTFAHVLSGVGSRAWKFNLTEDFTGLHARPTGAIFYARGEIVATMPATLPYEGAFPAPLRPQTLILPRSLAGWAHHAYSLTLRGRDALNAITDIHLEFKTKYGAAGIGLLKAISQHLTPAEYAMREDVALHEIEPLIQIFVKAGYLRDQ